jgi:hypothetical protein
MNNKTKKNKKRKRKTTNKTTKKRIKSGHMAIPNCKEVRKAYRAVSSEGKENRTLMNKLFTTLRILTYSLHL